MHGETMKKKRVHLTFENLGCGHAGSSLNGQIVASNKTPEFNYENTKLLYIRKIIRKGARSVGECVYLRYNSAIKNFLSRNCEAER
jgi:hypothetical protein